MNDTLVLFSKSFPYKTDESFLFPELVTVHSDFRRILIIPLLPFNKTDASQYKLPSNVEVVALSSNENRSGISSAFLFLFSILPTELFLNYNFKGFLQKLRYNF